MKFKKGDKVRVIGCDHGHLTVKEQYIDDADLIVLSGHPLGDLIFRESVLELAIDEVRK